jgi:ATP-dependent DNA helicase DinG
MGGQSPFTQSAMPKAGLRLRQGFGRVIRSTQDKGIVMILDDRIIKKTYGKKLLSALPKELPKVTGPIKDLFNQIDEFLI